MSINGRILIIDDEASIRQTLARILIRAGYEATTAANGRDAIFLLQEQGFDLIYMDIHMPDMNGLDVLKSIQAMPSKPPVILFTAQPDTSSAVEALRQGASDYLLKPIKPDLLLERTKSMLERMERERRKKELRSQIRALETELRKLDGDDSQAQTNVADANETDNRYLRRGTLILDLHTRRATLNKRTVTLPPTAFDYLVVLARHSPDLVDYQTLVTEAQGFQTDMRESQELAKWHIHHIRDALEPDKKNPTFIINVRNSGYRLVTD